MGIAAFLVSCVVCRAALRVLDLTAPESKAARVFELESLLSSGGACVCATPLSHEEPRGTSHGLQLLPLSQRYTDDLRVTLGGPTRTQYGTRRRRAFFFVPYFIVEPVHTAGKRKMDVLAADYPG